MAKTVVKNSEQKKRAVLVFLSGPHMNSKIKLRLDATIFGREKGDIIIDDDEISSTHCQIQEINGNYHIFDMNSTNGTFINNERIVKAILSSGDVVRVGTTSFKFTVEEEKNVRHVTTVFKPTSGDRSKSASMIETLIESELRASGSFQLKLFITYGNGKKEEVELNQRVIYVGRASSFGSFDSDGEISRKHLLIKVSNTGEVFIEDQGSTNGSFLNGVKIKGMHQVKPDDDIRVGDTHLQVKTRR